MFFQRALPLILVAHQHNELAKKTTRTQSPPPTPPIERDNVPAADRARQCPGPAPNPRPCPSKLYKERPKQYRPKGDVAQKPDLADQVARDSFRRALPQPGRSGNSFAKGALATSPP